jgi:hypothetical protein
MHLALAIDRHEVTADCRMRGLNTHAINPRFVGQASTDGWFVRGRCDWSAGD